MPSRESKSRHRVELAFDEYGISAKLICPDDGSCEPATICASCGRDAHNAETTPCYDCRDSFGVECWVRGWFDNLAADELLAGHLTVEIDPVFDGETCTAHIVDTAERAEAE